VILPQNPTHTEPPQPTAFFLFFFVLGVPPFGFFFFFFFFVFAGVPICQDLNILGELQGTHNKERGMPHKTALFADVEIL